MSLLACDIIYFLFHLMKIKDDNHYTWLLKAYQSYYKWNLQQSRHLKAQTKSLLLDSPSKMWCNQSLVLYACFLLWKWWHFYLLILNHYVNIIQSSFLLGRSRLWDRMTRLIKSSNFMQSTLRILSHCDWSCGGGKLGGIILQSWKKNIYYGITFHYRHLSYVCMTSLKC